MTHIAHPLHCFASNIWHQIRCTFFKHYASNDVSTCAPLFFRVNYQPWTTPWKQQTLPISSLVCESSWSHFKLGIIAAARRPLRNTLLGVSLAIHHREDGLGGWETMGTHAVMHMFLGSPSQRRPSQRRRNNVYVMENKVAPTYCPRTRKRAPRRGWMDN